MDLREILQRRLKKKPPSNENRPDPPATGTAIHTHDDEDQGKLKAATTKKTELKPRETPQQQPRRPKQQQPIELGTIQYCNITSDGRHGDYDAVLRVASQNVHKPIFANFVEWSGWQVKYASTVPVVPVVQRIFQLWMYWNILIYLRCSYFS